MLTGDQGWIHGDGRAGCQSVCAENYDVPLGEGHARSVRKTGVDPPGGSP